MPISCAALYLLDFHPPPPKVHPLFLIAAMSDKIREFIDIPQQFAREGNQVCSIICRYALNSSLPPVLDTLHQAFAERFVLSLPLSMSLF